MPISYFLDSVVYCLVKRCLIPLIITSMILLLRKFHPRGEEYSVMNYFIAFCANRKWSNLFDITHCVYIVDTARLMITTVAEKDKRRAGAKITSCQGNTYSVSRQITSCRGKLRRVGANYGASGQITARRGQLRRVRANYGASGQITARRGKLRRVGDNYGVSGQITACRGQLRRVGENYGVSGQITACRAKSKRTYS